MAERACIAPRNPHTFEMNYIGFMQGQCALEQNLTQQGTKSHRRRGNNAVLPCNVMLLNVRFLTLVEMQHPGALRSEDTHGNPPARRFPPALQLLPPDPADDKVYIHNAALPAPHCLPTSLPACLLT